MTIFIQSSANPTAANSVVAPSAIQRYKLSGLAQSMVDKKTEPMINTPPIVGVPRFSWCDAGPSSRIS
ncbi:MAG: hypothetical protein QM785_15425 [Pyrinomonadaceae bacterium]